MFCTVISDTARQAAKYIHYRDGDYYGNGSVLQTDQYGRPIKDHNGTVLNDKGLLYCGRCHKPKQVRLYSSVTKSVLEPYCLCECEQSRETAEHNRILCQEKELNAHHTLSRADSLMLRSTFEEDKYPDCSMSKIAHEYVNRWEIFYRRNNIGLYIYGNVGVGKTFYASCIANDIAKVYGSTVKALSITTALNELYSTSDKAGYISDLASYDLLILDDFGTERRTDYTTEQIFSIIDERYKTQKPLIVTSNSEYASLKDADDIHQQRINDRIRDMCIPIEYKGTSKRGIASKSADDSAVPAQRKCRYKKGIPYG